MCMYLITQVCIVMIAGMSGHRNPMRNSVCHRSWTAKETKKQCKCCVATCYGCDADQWINDKSMLPQLPISSRTGICSNRIWLLFAVDLLKSATAADGSVSSTTVKTLVKLISRAVAICAQWYVFCRATASPVQTYPSAPRRSLQPLYSKVRTIDDVLCALVNSRLI